MPPHFQGVRRIDFPEWCIFWINMWVHQAVSISEATADVYMLVIWLPSSVQNIHGGNEKLFFVEFVLSKTKVFPRLG